jgi:TatD DNase family protein
MIEYFDTHAHLFDDRFAGELPAVLDRTRAAGVVGILAVGIDEASSRASVDQANTYPEILRAAVGLQPNNLATLPATEWDAIVAMASDPIVAAIGETGLDRYWDSTPFAMQEDFFHRHLELSRQYQKPVVIHCRDAEADIISLLTSHYNHHGPIHGVMHSFTGTIATAQQCLDMGLMISFAGMITYKTAAELRAVTKLIPEDRLLIETDCPYLAPQPVRGRRNEPSYVVHTATVIAAERGMTLAALAAKTTANARRWLKW